MNKSTLKDVCDMTLITDEVDDGRIYSQVKKRRDTLMTEKEKMLNQLLDDINSSDSSQAYKEFKNGVLLGIFLVT